LLKGAEVKMGKKCLKCDYVRVDSDRSPEDECPKCGALYSKMEKLRERIEHEKQENEKRQRLQHAMEEENRKQQQVDEERKQRIKKIDDDQLLKIQHAMAEEKEEEDNRKLQQALKNQEKLWLKESVNTENSLEYVSTYDATRIFSQFVSGAGWFIIIMGVLIPIITAIISFKSITILSLLGIFGVGFWSGLFLVMSGQLTRALVDNADNTGKMLSLLRVSILREMANKK
jgi:predicted  nucleic acid-binding Zn-ribbon protein